MANGEVLWEIRGRVLPTRSLYPENDGSGEYHRFLGIGHMQDYDDFNLRPGRDFWFTKVEALFELKSRLLKKREQLEEALRQVDAELECE